MSDPDDSADDTKDGATAPKSDAEPSERDSEPAEREESVSKSEERPRRASGSKTGRSTKPGGSSRSRGERPSGGAAGGPSAVPSRAILIGVVALAAGAAGGWFGHEAQAKAKLRTDSSPAAVGSGAASGPCGAWEKKICASSGDRSAACEQAKGATSLLTTPACEAALEGVPATLAKVKAARAPCENLVTKLCNDLPKDSTTCQMVKDRTSSFPGDRCVEMLKNYDQVISQVRLIEEQNAAQMGASPHSMPPGSMPPGSMPPGSMPPGSMPPGAQRAPHP